MYIRKFSVMKIFCLLVQFSQPQADRAAKGMLLPECRGEDFGVAAWALRSSAIADCTWWEVRALEQSGSKIYLNSYIISYYTVSIMIFTIIV
uniref:Secreted protein n=1 Tax=Spironucleus salmonicida TaxID=348837 RepID=V6LZ61_9EUKA|eukprot:EST49568.1 Hypothetical protein SS50377_10068 [Spironucleus salmonicida]